VIVDSRNKLILGVKQEIFYPIDFTNMGWDAQDIVYFIHEIAYRELMNRNLVMVWDWSVRVKNMFTDNSIKTIGHVIHTNLEEINKFERCGFKTRREIYDTFITEFGIELKDWHPGLYYDKYYPKNEIGEDDATV
jgi:hypothetical protein